MVSASSYGVAESLPPSLAVPIGAYRGWLYEQVFSRNASISTLSDVWNQGGIKVYPTSAQTMDITSSSGDDKGTPTAGSGARTVTIFGLDSNYDLVNETVTLDGTNDVTTTQTFIRVYRMRVITAGSGGTNAGSITATATSDATIQADIAIGEDITQMSHYTVPNGYHALITQFTVGTQKGDQAEIEFLIRRENEVFTYERIYEMYQQSFFEIIDPAIRVGPKADMVFRAEQISGGANINVTASYDFYLVPSAQVNI